MTADDDMKAFKELVKLFSMYKPPTFRDVVELILKRINDAVKHQAFLDVLIKGGQGTGKSSLALYIMYKYYQDPDKVLKNVFFDVWELDRTILREKREVILFDDAGVTLNKWRSMTSESVDHYMILQIPRTRVNVMLYTCVSDSVAKFVRDTADIVIAFHTRRGYTAYGTLYTVKEKYVKVVKKEYDFEMNLEELHEDPVFHNLYVEYNKRREEFILSVMREILEKEEEKRGKSKKKEETEAERFIDELIKKAGLTP